MRHLQRELRHWRTESIGALIVGFLLLAAGCKSARLAEAPAGEVSLRIGVARFGSATAVSGLRAILQNLTDEGLVRIGDNGRATPRLAQGVRITTDGLSMRIALRPGVQFHDGSPVSADTVARILQRSLSEVLGPAFADINYITPSEKHFVDIGLKRPSPLLIEALEIPIRRPEGSGGGTGAFQPVASDSIAELRANRNYYLGSPTIDRITLTNYPSVRAAWADMLRYKVDMLFEVSGEALDSMKGATNTSIFSFVRPYQYLVVLNPRSPQLRAPAVRRALNLAIDRDALLHDALDGHGLPSSGPVWPRHWSFNESLPRLVFDPRKAATIVGKNGKIGKLRFTCLVPPDYERIALVVKRQLEAIGVEMELKQATADEAVQALGTPTFEAVLLDLVAGPSAFRIYQVWHSSGSRNVGALGSPEMDAALDRIRYAPSDDEYAKAIAAFQRFALDDPPAIFLAWGERARAISNRFSVPLEPDRDVLTTLRLWRPVVDQRTASRN